MPNDVAQRGQDAYVNTRLQQVARLVVGVAGVHHQRALGAHAAADGGVPLHHARGEGAHGGHKGIRPGHGAQGHGLGRGGADHQRAIGKRGIGVFHAPGAQAQAVAVAHQGVGRWRAARRHPHFAHAQARRKGLHVRMPLHARAHHQQRAAGVARQFLRRQQRHSRRAPRGDRGAVQNAQALAGYGVKHHHVALDAGQAARGVVGNKANELADSQPRVGGGHHKKAAAPGQRLHQACGNRDRGVAQQGFQVPGQGRVRQRLGGLGGGELGG